MPVFPAARQNGGAEMDWLMITGAVVSFLGLCGLVASAVMAMRARKSETEDAKLRARLSRIMPLNLAALFLSFIGLMLVVLGAVLG